MRARKNRPGAPFFNDVPLLRFNYTFRDGNYFVYGRRLLLWRTLTYQFDFKLDREKSRFDARKF